MSTFEIMYEDATYIYEAYTLFYNKIPDFSIENRKNIMIEFQAMVYLLENCCNIIMGNQKSPKYSFVIENCNFFDDIDRVYMPKSGRLQELVEFLIEPLNYDEFIKIYTNKFDEYIRKRIKYIGRLTCIKTKLDPYDLAYIARHYFAFNSSIEDELKNLNFKASRDTDIIYSTIHDDSVYHSAGFIREDEFYEFFELTEPISLHKSILMQYQYDIMMMRTNYQKNAMINHPYDPFIKYTKGYNQYLIDWSMAYKQLEEERKEEQNLEKSLELLNIDSI